jgi:D-3-phosphoglycerate dehydrogenase
MAGKAKVVLTDYVWESLDVEKNTLEGLASLVALQTRTAEEFLPEAEDCDALLNTYAGPITAAAMAPMPRCRIIAWYGIGVDTIDLDAATEAGIIVTNNPTYCIEEVAEHTMSLLLACARKVAFYDRLVRKGRWSECAFSTAIRSSRRDGSRRRARRRSSSRCSGRRTSSPSIRRSPPRRGG